MIQPAKLPMHCLWTVGLSIFVAVLYSGFPAANADDGARQTQTLGLVSQLEEQLNSTFAGTGSGGEDGEKTKHAWKHMKWLPPLAPYRVQGLPIEDLEPEFNFRRGYTLRIVDYEEDRTHILPFLRPIHDASMAKRKRRVLLDLGGKSFDSSMWWFIHVYPIEFTEIHVFEVIKDLFKVPKSTRSATPEELGDTLLLDSRSRIPAEEAKLPKELLSMITVWEKFVDIEDRPGGNGFPPSINITRFIRDVLKLTPNDTVVVKMDIEEAEWRILPAWIKDLKMPLIVDEIFIEVHYHHPSMAAFHWTPSHFHKSRAEATELFLELRKKGFYAHPWP